MNDLNWERFKGELHSALLQSELRTAKQFHQLRLEQSERSLTLMKLGLIVYAVISILGLAVLMIVLRK